MRRDRQKDPLGYNTSDPNHIREMARDALTGRNANAVQAELDALTRRYGGPPIRPTLRRRVRKCFSRRYWRIRYWWEDRR